jgi:hypothetical protein
MNILRGISRWFLAIIISLSLAVWFTVSVLLSTVFDADALKGWTASSGIYDKVLGQAITVSASQGAASKEDLQKALDATFTPGYLKQNSELMFDATYDWINGKAQNIEFTIPVKEKRAEYSANLQKILEAKFAGLPQCATRIPPNAENPTCIPQGLTAQKLAQQASQIPESSDFLRESFTPESFNKQFVNIPEFPSLPQIVSNMRTLSVVLPIVIVVCAGLYVLASDSKLRGLSRVGRQICLQGMVFTALGGLLWYLGPTADISALQNVDASQSSLINPLFQKAIADVGRVIMLFGSPVAAIGGAAWLTAFVIRRKQSQQPPATYKPPTTLPPTHPTSPL